VFVLLVIIVVLVSSAVDVAVLMMCFVAAPVMTVCVILNSIACVLFFL
jgi:hypothetical protein